MKRRYRKITILFLLLTIQAVACTSGTSQVVKVTQAISQPATITKLAQTTASPTLETSLPQKTATPYYRDLGYYEGIIAITQYYTLFGHGLFEEAYSLLSPSRPRHKSLDEYVANSKSLKITKINIVTIQPLYLEIERQGGRPYHPPDTMERKRFYVQIIIWGEERMVGAAVSGDLQTLFMTLVRENGEWRIYSADTAP